MNTEKETQLINLCQKDLKYFQTLYQWFVKDVFNFCYYLTRDKNQAEDVCADTFLIALENIHKYEVRSCSIKSWLLTIARNKFIRRGKQANRFVDIDNLKESEIAENDDILDDLISKEEEIRVKLAVKELTAFQQEIIRLKIDTELTFEDIAQLFQCKVSKIKMVYYRALSEVRNKTKNLKSAG